MSLNGAGAVVAQVRHCPALLELVDIVGSVGDIYSIAFRVRLAEWLKSLSYKAGNRKSSGKATSS